MLLPNNVLNFPGLEPPHPTSPALLNLPIWTVFCPLILLEACHLLHVIIGSFRVKAATLVMVLFA